MQDTLKYINTIRYLKASQIINRLSKKLIHKRIKWYRPTDRKIQKCPLSLKELDCDKEYLKRFSPANILENDITLLNQTYHWESGNWENKDGSHLWNFNLHYFEYGIALGASYQETGNVRYKQKLLELIYDWIDCVKEGDGWNPYTLSLRIPNWLIAFEIMGGPIPTKILDSIYTQYRWLLRNQEKHLLGNHYLENLKTIVICSHLFSEQDVFNRYLKKFMREVKKEVLPDGVHFELSLMYHKIILEDLIRIALILEYRGNPYLKELVSEISKMNTAVYSLERGMGKTPHFNDAGDNVARSENQLCAAVRTKWKIQPEYRSAFQKSGYYKLKSEEVVILFDCGRLGPRYMCGHSHCDALSFELSVSNKPILVNAGTFQYQDKRRTFFRSTEAHNTVIIAGEQQSELWGEHRAARRIRKVRCQYSKEQIVGSYVTYKKRYHQRKIILKGKSLIEIEDLINGPSDKFVSAFFHAAPGLRWEEKGQQVFCLINIKKKRRELKLMFDEGEACIHRRGDICDYAREFGRLEKSEVLEIQQVIKDGCVENKIRLEIGDTYD